MRLFYFFFFLLACTANKVWAQTPYKGVKQISVFTKAKTDKAPQLEYEMHFDKKGNQTKYHHPTHYCTQEWAYNAQDQVTKLDIMCGESFGNGTTVYQYLPTITKSVETTGAYERTIIDSLNAQKKPLSRTQVTKVLSDSYTPSPDTRIVYTYNAKNLPATETIYSTEGKTLKEYAYKGDSLHCITRTIAGKKDTLLLQDYQRDSGRRASKKYPINEYETQAGFYSEIYRYDDKGRIISLTTNAKSANNCPNPKVPCALNMKEYQYKNEQLFQVTETFYEKGTMTTYSITLYANGLPRETKVYDAKNEFIAHTTYKIQKW
ncbi:MAG: hypothetical protein EAZ95_07630 [Bacteroidetes bacterium]|nr:MAG: hypothetical protein EAZ95_07630 [Bacteroidota bacterium]